MSSKASLVWMRTHYESKVSKQTYRIGKKMSHLFLGAPEISCFVATYFKEKPGFAGTSRLPGSKQTNFQKNVSICLWHLASTEGLATQKANPLLRALLHRGSNMVKTPRFKRFV